MPESDTQAITYEQFLAQGNKSHKSQKTQQLVKG